MVGTVTVAEKGAYRIVLDAGTIERMAPDAKYIRVNLTAAGAAPSISYWAWLTNVLDNSQ